MLYAHRVLPYDHLHGYHCSCSHCDIDSSSYQLRAQTDSSCSGEFISGVYLDDSDDWDDARRLMLTLQEACVEVDAEPGYQAGFHVHVSRPTGRGGYVEETTLGRLLWNFCEWEHVLTAIAAGRFQNLRQGMNGSVRSLLQPYANAIFNRARTASMIQLRRTSGLTDEQAALLHDRHYGMDRHSNLSIRTRYETFEFRIWNSTRSAWRMELWCLLSLALMDPEFVAAMSDRTLDAEPTILMLIDLLNSNNRTRTGELLNRQFNYMGSRPIGVEPAFTVV